MATSEETCDGNPNFAVICSFITKFGVDCGVNISFPYLQQMLEDTKNDYEDLKELHVHLLRRGRKRVNKEKWEKSVIKFCHEYSSVDAWELERFGYKKAKLSVKLELLKHLLELQFDSNAKFKGEVNKQDAQVLRILPIGRDIDGHSYWYQLDKDYNMRLYKEGVGEENVWNLMCSTTDGLKEFLSKLQEQCGIVKEEECKTEPSESEMITETKPEEENEDRTSHISESKPCTIIIKTEKKENSSLNCASTEEKKNVVVTEISEASASSSVLPSQKLLDKPTTGNKIKAECPEVVDILPKHSKSSSEEMCVSDSSEKHDNQKNTDECVKMDTSDCCATDPVTPMEVQAVKSEELSAKTVKSNDVIMEDVEKLNPTLSLESSVMEESLPEKHSDVVDSNSKQNSSAEKCDPELKCKGSKIKLYEKWNKEKKKLASVQLSDKDTEQTSHNNAVSLTKADCSYLPIPSNLEVCTPSEKVSHAELVNKDKLKKDEYRQPVDETPMDLSVPSRNTISHSERKSPCEPAASSFKNKKALVQSSSDKHDLYHSYDNMSEHSLPLKKKHFSSMKEEPHVDNPENVRKSVIFEVKNSKLLNKYQGNRYNDPIPSNDRTASMGGSSHLLALQNMCENNLMIGSQNNMSSLCEKSIKPDDSHKILHVTNNKPSVPDIYEHISKNYSFSAAQITGNQNSTDYVATNTLLKPSAQYTKDKNSLSPVGREILKPHKTESLPLVSKHALEESLVQNKRSEANKYDQNSSKFLENIPLDPHSKSNFGGELVPQHPVTVFSSDNMKKYSMTEKNIPDESFSTNKNKDNANTLIESCISKRNTNDCHKLLGKLPEKTPDHPKNIEQHASESQLSDSKSDQLKKNIFTDTVSDCDGPGATQIDKHLLKNEDGIMQAKITENITSASCNVTTKNIFNKPLEKDQTDHESKHAAHEKSKEGKVKDKTDPATNREPVRDCKVSSMEKNVSNAENSNIQSEKPLNVDELSSFADEKKPKDSSSSDHASTLKSDEKSFKKVSSKDTLESDASKIVKEEWDASLSKTSGQDSSLKCENAEVKHAEKSSSSVSDTLSQDSNKLKTEPESLLKSNEKLVDSKTDDEAVSEKQAISKGNFSNETPRIASERANESNNEQQNVKKNDNEIALLQSKVENELLAVRSEDENELLAVKSEDENELLTIKTDDENELLEIKSEEKDNLPSKLNDKCFQSKGSTISENACKEQEGNCSPIQSTNHLLETKINEDFCASDELRVTTSETNDEKKPLSVEKTSEELGELSKSESKLKVEVNLQVALRSNESKKSLPDEKFDAETLQKPTSKEMHIVKDTIFDLIGKVLGVETISKEQNVPIQNEPSKIRDSKSVKSPILNEKALPVLLSEDEDTETKKTDTEDFTLKIENNFKHDKDGTKPESVALKTNVEKLGEPQSISSESVSEVNTKQQKKINESKQLNSETDSEKAPEVSVKVKCDISENKTIHMEDKKDYSSKTDGQSIAENKIIHMEDKEEISSEIDEQSIAESELKVKSPKACCEKSNEVSRHETLEQPPTLKHEPNKVEKLKDNEKSDVSDIDTISTKDASSLQKDIEISLQQNKVAINDVKCSKTAEAKYIEKIENKSLNKGTVETKSEQNSNASSKDSSKSKIICESNKTLVKEEAENKIKPHDTSSTEEQNKSASEGRPETESERKVNECKSSKDSKNSEIVSDSKMPNSVAAELEAERGIKDCDALLAKGKVLLPDVTSSGSKVTKIEVVEQAADDSCKKISEESEKNKLDLKDEVHDEESSDLCTSQLKNLKESSAIDSAKPCDKTNSLDEKTLCSEQKIKTDSVNESEEKSKVDDLQKKKPLMDENECKINVDTVSKSSPSIKQEDSSNSKDDETKKHLETISTAAENIKDVNEQLEEISDDATSKSTGGKTRNSARRRRSTAAANKTIQASNKKDISEPNATIASELSATEKKLHEEKFADNDIKDQHDVSCKSNSVDDSCKSKTEKGESQLDEPVEIPLPKRKGSMRKGRKGRNEIAKDENKSITEPNKSEIISESKAIKKESFPDALGLYYVLRNTCLESKLRHPLCSSRNVEKLQPKKPDKKPNLITGFSLDVEEDMTCDVMVTSVVKKKRGRLRNAAASKPPEIKPKPPSPKPPTPKTTRKRGSRNSKTVAAVTEKSDFNIPEGFLEILGKKESPLKKELPRKGRGKNTMVSEASLPSSDGESTPIKRSRRIQEQHKKKMSELAVEMEREQRMLEQLAKKSSAKKTTPQKVPAKTKEVKNCKVVKSKFQPPVPEETILDSKRTTRKMNSRSRSITKMTLMYEDESKDSEFSTSRETEKSKKRRSRRSGKRGYKPWDLSSESSSSIEEFTEEEEEEEPEEQLVFEVNEDEFACEEVEDDAEPVIVRRARTAKKTEGEAEEIVNDDKPCSKCGKYDRPEWILLCDKCDSGYHTTCLIPPLMLIPDGDWFCQPCEHMLLCECLQQELRKLESILKQKEREELRKQRLAYVGISLDNVLKPEKKEKSDESSKEEEDEEEEDEKENKTDKKISKKESKRDIYDDDRKEKLYGKRSVRARRNINYQFKEYDELIASAIGQEIFEEKVMEEDFQEEEDEKDDGSDKSFTARVLPKRKRKKRLNALDFSDEDEDSGEEYKGSSSDSECTAPQSSNYEGESNASDEWRVVKTKSKKAPRRKPRRGRGDSSEEDWGEESDSYRPVTRRAAQKAVNYREISSDEDEEWGASKAKKATIKRKKDFSSEESEASYKEKKPKKKARVRKWGSSSDSESEKSLSLNDESEEEEEDDDDDGGDSSQDSENEWKVKKNKEAKRLKLSINKKVLSTDEESESQESAPKKKPNKVVSEESSEEEDDDDEDEEESSEEEDEESEKSDEAASKLLSTEKKVEKQILKPKTPELVKETPKAAEVVKDLKQKTSDNADSSVNIKQTVSISASQDKSSLRTVKKDATKMVPCVIPYDKSPKSGHGTVLEEESDKISKVKENNANAVMPSHSTKTAIQVNPPTKKVVESAPPHVNLPPVQNKSFSGTIMEPFDEDDPDSDEEVPLERIPTACVPNPMSNKPPTYEKTTEYTPAKELSTFSYSAPEKCFPSTYTSLATFQDYSSRPSPLKPSLVESYPTNSSPSKLTPLDTYSQSSSPKGFISLDSYTEARKKKHFYGNPSSEPEASSRPIPPVTDNYQGEIRFPPEPYPCPSSPNAYSHRSPPPPQRDPGTPPRMYSQFPDAYAPPRSPEYYQNHQYYASEERIPRPSYQPNYAPSEQGPPFVPNPYVATPVPQPNGGFMIDTLLRARNENEEDELTGVTDIVSYITQE